MIAEKNNTEREYDLFLSKYPERDWLQMDKINELFKNDFPPHRLLIIIEILAGEKRLLRYSASGYRLTDLGMEIKSDLKHKGFVALKRKETNQKFRSTLTLCISILTLLFVMLGFFFKK